MTDTALRQHIYIALAFQTILATEKDFYAKGTSTRVLQLAQQMSDFCNLHAPSIVDMPAVHLVNEAGAEELDTAIEDFIGQRRKEYTAALPDDEATLLKLYDRLQQRAARRVNRLLFASMSTVDLKKRIISQIDGEIEERGVLQ